MRIKLFLLLISLLFSGNIFAADITTLTLFEKDNITTVNYPLTFGHVFKDGDVTDYVAVKFNSIELPTQFDIKTTYDDGSVRFAIISVMLPKVISSSTNIITLVNKGTAANAGELDKTQILATDIESQINLTGLSGSGYSGNLTASLRTAVNNASQLKYWLKGSVCSEILIEQRLNNSLNAAWEARFYPGTSFGIRISNSIENMDAYYRGNVNYAVDIRLGLTSPAVGYSKGTFIHNESSRWRKVLWLGPAPPEVELHYDLPYLISTGAIMNYDISLKVPESTLADSYSKWSNSDHDIMGNGFIQKYFPTTGGRGDIGILPRWAVRYLLTMDNRMREITLNNGEMIASAPAHYRESDASRSFHNHPISVDDRSTVWTTADRAYTYGATADKLPAPIGEVGNEATGWTIDRAHQGSFAYIPYLITGEHFYLQEMYYWAAWCLSSMDYNSSWGRNYAKGLLRDQVRGEAWALRNLIDASAFAEDGSLEQSYFTAKVANNISVWISEKDRYPLNFWGIDKYATTSGLTSVVQYPTSPWMEDFMLLSLVHAKEQQFDTSSILDWYGEFIINRFSNPDFNWYNGCPYRFPAQLTDGTYPQNWSQANSLFAEQPTSFPLDDSPDTYRFNALAALSTQVDKPKGQEAYNWLKANVNDQDKLNVDPTWAIVPRTTSTAKLKILSIEVH